MSKGFFITGTDTNVGKSIVSAALTYLLKAIYWKPINTGESDLLRVQELTGLPEQHFLDSIYQFSNPLSPDQAASKENRSIDLDYCNLPHDENRIIVEGAGGVYAPLNTQFKIIDLITKFSLPTIVVTRGTLGTINHTLLTIEALLAKQIPVKGVVFSGELNPDNQSAIEKWTGIKTLFHIPPIFPLNQITLNNWVNNNKTKIMECLS